MSSGVSSEVYRQLRATLLSCGPFDSNDELKAVFVDARISPWRHAVPQAHSAVSRVDAIISYLSDKHNTQQENALVLFLRVLSERVDPGDICHQDLAQAADRLEQELGRPRTGSGSITADAVISDVYSSYEAGLHQLLERLGKEHPRYFDALAYQQRLVENIARARQYGDTEAARAERSETIARLDRLTISVLGIPFSELTLVEESPQKSAGRESATQPIQTPPGRMTKSDLLQVIERAADEGWTLLDLSGRGLAELPSEIGRLTKLQRLDLRDNQLAALPPEIADLRNLERLDLQYNPFLPIPPEILARVDEPSAIIGYYLESQTEAEVKPRALNEVKVILVGQGGVGKTSLVNRLIDNAFDPDESKTQGISVRRWYIPVDGEKVCLNIWDFGGQEIMHTTHQFFLTRRSLYLLVLDTRKGEQESNVEYWLKLIQSFGEESPIIVVINKVDAQLLDLNRRGLQEKYPTIKAFVNTSCKDGTGIDDLLHTIRREVNLLPHIRTPWPGSWFAVKRRLEKMEQDYIPYDAYQLVCVDAGATSERDQRTLVSFLHDLGIVLNYRDDPRLEETNILNPEWVTSAVYRILNNQALFHSKGVLKCSQLGDILDPRQYPSHKYNFIIGIMRKFELCFPIDDFDGESYLIPDLLQKEEPYVKWPRPEDCLLFQYDYHVLPSSVISRFIVRMHDCIGHNTYWRTGVVLAYQGNEALVRADLEERKVTISVTGHEHTRREFLAIIRSNFDHIHRTIPRIEARAQVPIPGHPDIAVDYQHLLTLEQLRQETFVPSGLSELTNIKRLLDGVDAGRSPLPSRSPDHRQYVSRLRSTLVEYFDTEELRTLFFDLGIEFDMLQGEGKTAKARELIAYLDRRGRLPELLEAIKIQRPDIPCPDA